MFGGNFKEASEGVLDVPHSSAEVVQAVLTFVYLGTFDEETILENCPGIYEVASEWQLGSLANVCAAFLFKHMSEVSVKSTLILANLHGDGVLRNRCFEYARENAPKVLIRPDVMALQSEEPELWGDMCMAISGSKPEAPFAPGVGTKKKVRKRGKR